MFLALDGRGVICGYSKYPAEFGGEYVAQETDAITKTPSDAFDDRWIPCYRYDKDGDTIIRRTQSEMDADYTEPEAAPTIESRVETVEGKTNELQEALEMILSGVTE